MDREYWGHPHRHGKHGTTVYNIWAGMLQRCLNPKDRKFHHYGGRGITVCEEWRDFVVFYDQMGDPPAGHTLERIDNEKGYSLANCRWATMKEQSRNTRSNLLLTLHGITKTAAEWAEDTGINRKTLYSRKHKGWTDEQALTQPVRPINVDWRNA